MPSAMICAGAASTPSSRAARTARHPSSTTASYQKRNRIERMFGHLKINRAVATRYDQLPESFLSMIQIAATRYLLKFVHAA